MLEKAGDSEAKVFFYRIKGDYNSYISEYAENKLKQQVSDGVSNAYKAANDLEKDLPASHPISLGFALNYPVYYLQVLGDHAKAFKIAIIT